MTPLSREFLLNRGFCCHNGCKNCPYPPEIRLVPEFITEQEEKEILKNLASSVSKGDGNRSSIKRYGSSRPYGGNLVSEEIPDYLKSISNRLVNNGYLEYIPDSVSINEYNPGDGIDYHIDSLRSGDIITTLSILGHADMVFKKGNKELIYRLEPRTMTQFWGKLRYEWKHCILPVTEKRYSIVFRKSKFEL